MSSSYIQKTKNWIQKIVIDLNLCPFAKEPFGSDRILYVVIEEPSTIPVVNEVLETIDLLNKTDKWDTAFIITPGIDLLFQEYLNFVNDLQELVSQELPDFVKLIAFHPDFQYRDTPIESTQNATNRSPFPMIHILRKSDLDQLSDHSKPVTEHNRTVLLALSWKDIHSGTKD